MSPDRNIQPKSVATENGVIGDDSYLVEMSDRLRRLRSLLGDQEKRDSSTKRWHGLRASW